MPRSGGLKPPIGLSAAADGSCAMRFKDRTILCLQSEAMVAIDLQSVLEDEGATVVMSARALEAGNADCLLVDNHGTTDPLVAQIHARGVPLIVYTGNPDGLSKAFPTAIIVNKPAPPGAVRDAVHRALVSRPPPV